MSIRSFHEIYLHVNWHCEGSRRMISETMEPELHQFIAGYCKQLSGVYFHGVGGIETHLHVVLQIVPSLAPSEVIGRIKGASAHEMNRRFGPGALLWQAGFGIVSFAKLDLPGVQRYVANQRQHHTQGTIKGPLEATGAIEDDDRVSG